MTARVIVHADGGACHGTPIVDGRCPKCGIAPDTQSTELWAQPPERRPCAGWSPDGYFPPGLAYELRAGEFSARVDEAGVDQAGDSEWGWSIAGPSPYERIIVRRNYAPTLEAAQLAAEDALRAVAAEILRAVGQ